MKRIGYILICIVMTIQIIGIKTYAKIYESSNMVLNADFSGGKEPWFAYNIINNGGGTMTVENRGPDGSPCAVISNSSSGRLTQMLTGLVGSKKGEKYYISAKMKLATQGKKQVEKQW